MSLYWHQTLTITSPAPLKNIEREKVGGKTGPMTSFSEEALERKLKQLVNTQQSIQTLSHWIIYHRKNASRSVSLWEKLFYDLPAERKLVFVYLCNDVCQTSRRKGGEFIQAFGRVLPGAGVCLVVCRVTPRDPV